MTEWKKFMEEAAKRDHRKIGRVRSWVLHIFPEFLPKPERF